MGPRELCCGEKFAIRNSPNDDRLFFFLGSLTLPSIDIVGIQIYTYLCPIFNFYLIFYVFLIPRFSYSHILIFYIYELIDI